MNGPVGAHDRDRREIHGWHFLEVTRRTPIRARSDTCTCFEGFPHFVWIEFLKIAFDAWLIIVAILSGYFEKSDFLEELDKSTSFRHGKALQDQRDRSSCIPLSLTLGHLGIKQCKLATWGVKRNCLRLLIKGRSQCRLGRNRSYCCRTLCFHWKPSTTNPSSLQFMLWPRCQNNA